MVKESYPMQTSRLFYLRFSNTYCRFNYMRRISILAGFLLIGWWQPVFASSRIKDVAHFTGVRNNSLTGYGLVTGLKGTGDKQQTIFTQQMLKNMLDRSGVNLDNQVIRVQNVAA